jgi:PIN domain nuclease of toxin-antitoxin system
MQAILLDTCAAIWIVEDEGLSIQAESVLNELNAAGGKIYVSPITAWEVGQLVARHKLHLPTTPQRWFALLSQASGVRLAEMTPDILIESSFLPGKLPRDPADRIMAATARHLGITLMTRDRALLDYGKQGHVNVMAC